MIKVKDGYAKLVGTTASGSASHILLSNGSVKAVSDFAMADGTNATGTWNIDINGNASSANRAKYLETQYQENTNWYGNSYKAYLKWETSTIAKLKIDGYFTKVDYSVDSDKLDGLDSFDFYRHKHIGYLTNKDLNYANNQYGTWSYGDDSTLKNTPTITYGCYLSWGNKADSDDSTTRNQTAQIGVDCWSDLGRMFVRARQAGARDVSSMGNWRTVAFTTDIPTVTDYYWANIKVSTTSNTGTSPTFNLINTNQAQVNNYIFMNPSGEGIYLNNSGLHWHNKGTYTKGILHLTKDGLVGVGTTPSWKLDVSGTFNSSNYQVGGALELKTNDTACQTTIFGSNNSGYRMRIIRQDTATNLNTLYSPTLVISSLDTHAYIAWDYNGTNVWVGGGAGNKWNWRSTLINTSNYGSYLGYVGTTAVLKSSAAQSLTGITRISNASNNALYLGNANNTGWVLTLDICSHSGTSKWAINVNGQAWFSKLMVGITYNGTGSGYAANISGDSHVTGWSRAGAGFYVLDTGVHYSINSNATSCGEIALTSNNEFNWGSSNLNLYFNHRAASRGTTVTTYIWNAGSSSSYASHQMGNLYIGTASLSTTLPTYSNAPLRFKATSNANDSSNSRYQPWISGMDSDSSYGYGVTVSNGLYRDPGYSSGGYYIGIGWDGNASSVMWKFNRNGETACPGPIYIYLPSSNRRAGIIGSYDPNRAAAIWTIGASYQIAADGTSFGSLYGAAYAYYGSGYTFGSGKSGGHSFVWCQNGTPYAALGDYVWALNGFIKNGSSNSYMLLGGGGHKAISDFAAALHDHSRILDAGNSSITTFAYSKAGLGYGEYTWLAGWNGYELRAISKNLFATASHNHNGSYVSTGGMVNGAYAVIPTYNGETGWHRIATIDGGTGYGSWILYLCGDWSWASNTNAILHINTMHTTARITQVSGIVGFATDVRLVPISANNYYVDVYINYSGANTPGTVYCYFLGNGAITTRTTVEKITASVSTAASITLVTGTKTNDSSYAAHFYENSDIRYKTIINNLAIKANQLANLPLFDFKWLDNEDLLNTGTSAQAVQELLPYIVSGTDKLTLDYGVLGTIAGITACRELTEQEKEINKLKEQIKFLKDEINNLKTNKLWQS